MASVDFATVLPAPAGGSTAEEQEPTHDAVDSVVEEPQPLEGTNSVDADVPAEPAGPDSAPVSIEPPEHQPTDDAPSNTKEEQGLILFFMLRHSNSLLLSQVRLLIIGGANCLVNSAGEEGASEAPKDPRQEAFEKQLEEVKSSSGDFDKWCQLLSAAEKLVCC